MADDEKTPTEQPPEKESPQTAEPEIRAESPVELDQPSPAAVPEGTTVDGVLNPPGGRTDPPPLLVLPENEQEAADPATVSEDNDYIPEGQDPTLGSAEPGAPSAGGVDPEEDPGPEAAAPVAAPAAPVKGADEADHEHAAPAPVHKHEDHKKEDAHKGSIDLNMNPDGMSAPFQTALARRFDKIPVVWGNDSLAVNAGNFQSRLSERMAHCEAMRVADQLHSKEPSAHGATTDSDKQSKPERQGKYRPDIKMYRDKSAVSEEQLTELIWGSYEQRTIDLFFAWEQARQSSELSHILERITNIEGVTAFIIFDIYENEKYPPELDEYDDHNIEEDENGFPVKREQQLQLIDGKWEIPPHIIYTSTDLSTAKKIIPFTKQLIWRLIETTRDLDPKNDVRYLRLISDINEIVVMPMFPRHFLIAVQEPKSSPNVLFENLGLVTTHPVNVEKDESKRKTRHRSTIQRGPTLTA